MAPVIIVCPTHSIQFVRVLFLYGFLAHLFCELKNDKIQDLPRSTTGWARTCLFPLCTSPKSPPSLEINFQFEEIIRGTTSTLLEVTDIKGEVVIVVAGKTEEEIDLSLSILEEVNLYIEQGQSSKDAIKQVAKNRNLTKNEVYMEFHKE